MKTNKFSKFISSIKTHIHHGNNEKLENKKGMIITEVVFLSSYEFYTHEESCTCRVLVNCSSEASFANINKHNEFTFMDLPLCIHNGLKFMVYLRNSS